MPVQTRTVVWLLLNIIMLLAPESFWLKRWLYLCFPWAAMEELSPSDMNELNARYGPSWPPSNEASGRVKFVSNPQDRSGQKCSFEFEFEIHPDELRKGLAEPARQRDLMCSVINCCKPMILDAKPWMCMACDLQACEMMSTPRLDTLTPGLMPVITDLLPLFICTKPACEAEARRFTERVLKDTSRDARFSSCTDLRKEQAYTCSFCWAIQPRVLKKLLQCGQCRAEWYCDRVCQRKH